MRLRRGDIPRGRVLTTGSDAHNARDERFSLVGHRIVIFPHLSVNDIQLTFVISR